MIGEKQWIKIRKRRNEMEWHGKPIEELSREELIKAVYELHHAWEKRGEYADSMHKMLEWKRRRQGKSWFNLFAS